jgi:hypothetical protein
VTELELRNLSLESAAWAEAAGTIYGSQVLVHRGSKRTSYEPAITYGYNVDGERFTGTRILFASETSESMARDLVDRFRPGDTAIVWFRPADPKVSVLLRQSWEGWPGLAAWLFFVLAFGGMTVASASGSVLAIRAALQGEAETSYDAGHGREERPGPDRILGTFAEASDRRLDFVRSSPGPGWRVILAAIGAVGGPAIAPLAPMAGWMTALVVLFSAVSLVLAYAALPELALASSSLAPLRHRLRVERDDPDPYRGEPVCSGRIDGRAFAPDPRRALLDVRIDRLVAHVLVIGAQASIVAYAFGPAASAALRRTDKEAGAGRPGSMADLAAAVARVLHVEKRSARPSAELPRLRWWPLSLWLGARGVVYVAVASYAPLDPLLGLFVATLSGLAALAIEAAVVRLAIAAYFLPAIETLGREVRATIGEARDDPRPV